MGFSGALDSDNARLDAEIDGYDPSVHFRHRVLVSNMLRVECAAVGVLA
ncbi:MAG: hypothetical protein IPO61_05635 [Gammaproteobacteria bacterium]|nr:hypothetical protein [Gammaproteobacteria bacterium]